MLITSEQAGRIENRRWEREGEKGVLLTQALLT